MKIYLYLKQHNITGLKYLGQTKRNPHIYRGSGKRWLNHLKKHGNDVNTTILAECSTQTEIKNLGLYYSTEWDIVNNVEFANLIIETGSDDHNSSRLKKFNNILTSEFKKERASNAAKSMWKNLKDNPDNYNSLIAKRQKQINPMQGKKQKRASCISCRKNLPVNLISRHFCCKAV